MSGEVDRYDELLAEAGEIIGRLRAMDDDAADEAWAQFGRDLHEWNERAREELGAPEH